MCSGQDILNFFILYLYVWVIFYANVLKLLFLNRMNFELCVYCGKEFEQRVQHLTECHNKFMKKEKTDQKKATREAEKAKERAEKAAATKTAKPAKKKNR